MAGTIINPLSDPGVVDISGGTGPNGIPVKNNNWEGAKTIDNNYLDNIGPYMDRMRSQVSAIPQNNPWLHYQMQQEALRQKGQQDNLMRAGARDLEQQQGQMAMRGGLNSGSIERLGSQNLRGMLEGQVSQSRTAGARETGIRSQAGARHAALAGRLGDAEMGLANFNIDIDKWNATQINKDNAAWHAANSQRSPESVTSRPPIWEYDTNELRKGNLNVGGEFGVGFSYKGESGSDDDAYLSIGGRKIF